MSQRHRLNNLLGMRIRFPDGQDGDQVTDVRLVSGDRVRGVLAELVTDGLVVGRRRPGTLFGYDRDPRRGPWMIRAVLRFLHRHTCYLAWEDVVRIDWDERVVHVRAMSLQPLAASRVATDRGRP